MQSQGVLLGFLISLYGLSPLIDANPCIQGVSGGVMRCSNLIELCLIATFKRSCGYPNSEQ